MPGGSGAKAADAPVADINMAMTLVAAMTEIMERKERGERRSDERVPSVYAEQGVRSTLK